jgi:hypothetical protein
MELYRLGSEEPIQVETINFDFKPDYYDMWGWVRFGSDEPGSLYPSPYKVKIFLNGTFVSESGFTMNRRTKPFRSRGK